MNAYSSSMDTVRNQDKNSLYVGLSSSLKVYGLLISFLLIGYFYSAAHTIFDFFFGYTSQGNGSMVVFYLNTAILLFAPFVILQVLTFFNSVEYIDDLIVLRHPLKRLIIIPIKNLSKIERKKDWKRFLNLDFAGNLFIFHIKNEQGTLTLYSLRLLKEAVNRDAFLQKLQTQHQNS